MNIYMNYYALDYDDVVVVVVVVEMCMDCGRAAHKRAVWLHNC